VQDIKSGAQGVSTGDLNALLSHAYFQQDAVDQGESIEGHVEGAVRHRGLLEAGGGVFEVPALVRRTP
jgi:hypothetical protein